MTEQIKVLQINAGSRQFGGVSAFVFNLFTHIDKTKVTFDFLSPNITTYEMVRNQIEACGGNIYELGVTGSFPVRTYRLFHRLQQFLKNHSYDAIHINSGSVFFNYVVSSAAKKAKTSNIIVHSHSSVDEKDNPVRNRVFQKLRIRIEKNADVLLACSKTAAEFMFTANALKENRVKVIYNGIDLNRFTYAEETRNAVRKNLGVQDKFVIGTAGRLETVKNHRFLLDVIRAAHDLNQNVYGVIYGSGSLKEDLLKQIRDGHMEEYVRIFDPVKDIERAYMAMDVFVLPSLYEGLPFTALEAQAIGLPVVMSDCITKEVSVCGNVSYLPLTDPAEAWAAQILRQKEWQSGSRDLLKKAGFDIGSTADGITEIYQNLMKGHRYGS